MPGDAHIFTVQLSLIILHYTHGPGSWTLQEKEKGVKMDPSHGPPLQARVAAANVDAAILVGSDEDGQDKE